jgi:hypothetical protein
MMNQEEIDQEISAVIALLKQLPEEEIREVHDFITWVAEKRSEKELADRFSKFA